MTDFLRRHSVLITTVLLLITSFQLMGASIQNPALPRLGGRFLNGILSPSQSLYENSADSIHDVWQRYVWLIGVEAEREDLQKRIDALEAQNSRLIEFEHQNQRLQKLLNFVEESGLKGIVASVVGRDPSNWVRTITIDRGSVDGIQPNQAVVAGNAVVGQTTVVNEHSAKVLLLTDNASAIDAIAQGSRAPGFAEGTGQKNLRLRYVLKEHPVQIGDRVISSGLDGIYPKGLLIGVVTQADPNLSGLFQGVDVEPNVDLFRLENVLILAKSQRNPDEPRNSEVRP